MLCIFSSLFKPKRLRMQSILNLSGENIAFIGKVNYFGGNLLMLKPKKDCNLNNIVDYLNTEKFKNNFIFSPKRLRIQSILNLFGLNRLKKMLYIFSSVFSGRFKIGHRQLSNSYIDSSYI